MNEIRPNKEGGAIQFWVSEYDKKNLMHEICYHKFAIPHDETSIHLLI